jgi:competence protein CoiA
VLAYKGEAKVAIEIQWSPQTNEESLNRQERYRQSGVRCLWLFRPSGFPVSKDFPAARVSGDLTRGFKVHLGCQEMPVDEFLDAVFAKRFRYGIPLGAKAIVRIHGKLGGIEELKPLFMFIDVSVGTHRFRLRADDLNDFPDLLASCDGRIQKALSICRINWHYSGRLTFEEAPVTEFQTTICERWVKAIEAIHHPDVYGWLVAAFE